MRIEVVKQFTFDAAHYLPNYRGKCANLHGHTYILEVGIKEEPDQESGMVIDFGRLKQIVERNIIEKLDHQNLNEVDAPFFPTSMPTAERMVQWIVKVLRNFWPNELSFVRLYETPTSYAEWRR